MTPYEIYAIRYAHNPNAKRSNNFIGGDPHDGPMPLDYNVWIIRNRHRTILVDSGYSPRHAEERGRPLDFNLLEGLA